MVVFVVRLLCNLMVTLIVTVAECCVNNATRCRDRIQLYISAIDTTVAHHLQPYGNQS